MFTIDVGIVVIYVVGCTLLGSRLGTAGRGGLAGYFIGERSIPAWAVMISIVATETSAVTFLSVPSLAYGDHGNLAYLQLALGFLVARFVVAIWFMPLYFQGEILSAYEVLATRFGGETQKVAAVLFLVTRTLGSGIRLFLAAKVLEVITGWPIGTSILVIGTATLVYTYLGGIKGVIWADVLQFAVYMLGAFVALIVLDHAVPGGWSTILQRAGAAGKLRIWNFDPSLTVTFTFWSGLIGGLALDMGTHGADQMMVQRYLAARSQKQAARALIASGFVIVAQFALFLLIGVALWHLYQISPPARLPARDQEFATFIRDFLPVGVRGLVIAAVFSVTMSTVAGALSASASSTVNDLLRPLLPSRDEAWFLRLSGPLTAVWGLAQMAVAYGSIHLKQAVVENAQTIAGFVTGVLLGLFLLAFLVKQARQRGAFVGTIAGLAAVSLARFGTNLAWPWYAVVGSGTVCLMGWMVSWWEARPKEDMPTSSHSTPEVARRDLGS